jgi:site-specific DNA-adenine methylase
MGRGDSGDETSLDGETDPVKTIAVFRGSPNGRGPMSGGPARNPRERWPRDLVERIRHWNRLGAGRVTVEQADCFRVIPKLTAADLLYADPPYRRAGPSLYRHAFTDDDHSRLADEVRVCPARWYVSYDNDPLIRKLYDAHNIVEIPNRHNHKNELLICCER